MVIQQDTGKYGHKNNWILLDRKKKRVLRDLGPVKPSDEKILKEEKRINWFKNKSSTHVSANNPGARKPRKAHDRDLLAWKKKQKRGKIMKPSTFKKIEAGAERKYGKERAKKIAGSAYWKTAKSKFERRER